MRARLQILSDGFSLFTRLLSIYLVGKFDFYLLSCRQSVNSRNVMIEWSGPKESRPVVEGLPRSKYISGIAYTLLYVVGEVVSEKHLMKAQCHHKNNHSTYLHISF